MDAGDLPRTDTRPSRRWTQFEAVSAVRTWAETATDYRESTYAAAAQLDSELPLPSQLDAFGGWRAIKTAIGFWS